MIRLCEDRSAGTRTVIVLHRGLELQPVIVIISYRTALTSSNCILPARVFVAAQRLLFSCTFTQKPTKWKAHDLRQHRYVTFYSR